MIKNKRILVTGGSGVIGRQLLSLLAEDNVEVLSIDREPLDRVAPDVIKRGVRHIEADLSETSLEPIRDFAPQVVFHLAAGFERSSESPGFWYRNWQDNTLLSHRMVELAGQLPTVAVFVFASSYLIYAKELYMQEGSGSATRYLTESDMVDPRNVTGASKYYTERELQFVNEVVNPALRCVNARIYRVFGRGSKDVISRWIGMALEGQVVEVYNKENAFDFIYAADVAEGLYRLACSGDAHGVVNLASGVSTTIAQVLDILGVQMGLRYIDKGITERIERSGANLERLKESTGWLPSISVSEGIRMVAEYERAKRAK
ncbi:NAD-dependent epimerase/dehydratase family protein [Candidatus Magnetobacterium casense]|uniref:NAD-dependent epimerase/dehydratase family protein n=1 Tax=Candidatus Magnetobacterium casense TaxID=1455061 RepID=UPI00059031A9|nr:NAD-dependent epimerase/dehydratase family protein [Candidatus Magnetobacterium casensis]